MCKCNEWQKIDSAPKDGTWMLLHMPKYVSTRMLSRKLQGFIVIGRFYDGHWYMYPGHDYENKLPTHWQPLPKGPKDED